MVTDMTYSRWRSYLESGGGNGYSPGGAAAELGMTRQGIMYAIKAGLLDALRVDLPGQDRNYWIIPVDALERYKRERKTPA